MKFLKYSLLILCFSFSWLFSQEKHQYYNDIQQFKKIDAEKTPPKNAILLIGSSSFTNWKDVADYFPTKTIINRGFGGSRLVDLNYFAEDLLHPYQPKQILIYCGDNDFVGEDHPSVSEVVKRFKTFYQKIREKFPEVNVGYVSIKHSPSREHLWKKMNKTNHRISRFLKHQKNTAFIDINKTMTDENGKVRKDLFHEDMLHIKPEGYLLWAQEISKYLK